MTLRPRMALWVVAVWVGLPLAALAQNNPFRGGNIRSVPLDPQPTFSPGWRPAPIWPGWGGPIYTAGYGNSAGPTLSGLADLTSAQGQYLNDWQSARMTNQQVEQEKLRTRRMAAELRSYERSLIPPLEELREQERQRELRRAMGDPPVTEILSAGALNAILKDLQDAQSRRLSGPSVPLDVDTLARINVAAPTGGNVGVFNNGGRVNWPFALTASQFETERTKVETAMQQLLREGERGGIEGATVRQYLEAVQALEAKVDSEVRNMSLSNLTQVKRQLTELNAAGTALQGPDPDKLFSKRGRPQGRDVAELVSFMTQSGMRFGPASRGDETAYRALHFAMVTYNLGLRQASVRQ